MDTVIPTIPGTASLRFYYSRPVVAEGFSNAWFQYNFLLSGGWSDDYSLGEFDESCFTHLEPSLGAIAWPTNIVFPAYWRINDAGGPRQVVNALTVSADYSLPDCNICIGASIYLYSTLRGPSGTGRVHWPWIYPEEMDGGRLTDDFYTRIQPLIDFYMNGFEIDGLGFIPAVWSRKLNAMHPITRVYIPRTCQFLRKRNRPVAGRDPAPFLQYW